MRILLGILATSNVGQASPVYVHLGIIVSFNVEGFDLREKKTRKVDCCWSDRVSPPSPWLVNIAMASET